jgi:hypothetical protein
MLAFWGQAYQLIPCIGGVGDANAKDPYWSSMSKARAVSDDLTMVATLRGYECREDVRFT